MIANNTKNSSMFGASGAGLAAQAVKADGKLTMIKSERKNRKKQKKSMRVQEV